MKVSFFYIYRNSTQNQLLGKLFCSQTFFFLFAVSLLGMDRCILFQSVTEPSRKILRRGSCISFEIPPITLTPTQTAIERQLLGEQIQIEPNGWLITSAQNLGQSYQSRSRVKQTKKQAIEAKRYYIEKGALEFYEKRISYYRSVHVIGESFDGKLRIIPVTLSPGATGEERVIVGLLIAEINRSRKWIYEYNLRKIERIGNTEETYQDSLEEVKQKYIYFYYEKSKKRSGEWRYTANKKWKFFS